MCRGLRNLLVASYSEAVPAYVIPTAEPPSDGRGRPIENKCGCDVQMLELIDHSVKGYFTRLDPFLNVIDADVQNYEICLAWYNVSMSSRHEP